MSQTKINIKTKDIELTSEIRSKVEEKIAHIEKFLNPTDDQEIIADVEVGKKFGEHHQKGDVYRAEINLNCDGKFYRAESTSFDIIVAIDETTSEIVKQIRRKDGRRRDLIRRGGKKIKKMLKFGRD